MRTSDRRQLALGLQDARQRTLTLLDAYARQLPLLQVRQDTELNPPLWELGHLAWFEEYWIARNPQRLKGQAAQAEVARAASILNRSDGLYNSSQVAHSTRWKLDLPSLPNTLQYARQARERTLELLSTSDQDDASLYFYRLALFHEDMHAEAWVYMAQNLGLTVPCAPIRSIAGASDISVPAGQHSLGTSGPGFYFDNEAQAQPIEVAEFAIDSELVSWARYLPFIEEGAYKNEQWWSIDGWHWAQTHAKAGHSAPRYLRKDGSQWQCQRMGHWRPLNLAEPAIHLSYYEAQAWCRWAGRRLPTEAEWEYIAAQDHADFKWGDVWEWTASPFAPYQGFEPHPYRDYSMPWFDGRPVLRGASFASAPRMKHLRYRNYFPAARNDIFAGFRSCAR